MVLNAAAQMPFFFFFFERLQVHTNFQVGAGTLVFPRRSRDHPGFVSHQKSNCQSAPALFTHISFQSDAQIRAWTHQHVTGPKGDSFTVPILAHQYRRRICQGRPTSSCCPTVRPGRPRFCFCTFTVEAALGTRL